PVAADERDVAPFQERRERTVVSGKIGECTDFLPSGPSARSEEERVAGPHLDPCLLFPRLDVLDVHVRGRLQVRDSLQTRNVQKDATSDDSILEDRDAQLRAAALFAHDLIEGKAVVQLSVMRNVAKRIEMRERRPVKTH